MPPLKTELAYEPDFTPNPAVKTESVEFSSQEQQDAAAIAGYLNLPLVCINVWTAEEKHRWLKCMLVKHINWSAMEPSQKQATASLLSQVNASLMKNSDALLENLIDLVEAILTCQVIGQKLRHELAVWRFTASNESLTAAWVRPHSKQSPSSRSSDSGSDKIWRRRSSNSSGISRRGSQKFCNDLLWEHIVRMLETGHPAVRWLEPQKGLFQFVQSSAAARSWGATKSNENMSFEKMSRSIRQYYRPSSGIMVKVPNKGRLVYQLNLQHPHVIRFLKENFSDSLCLSGEV